MEEPVQFSHNNKLLYGILHIPDQSLCRHIIVTMVVGGPQTRVGSHRLYVQLARFLCNQGMTVFRFDYEGIGDSEGNFKGFLNSGPSIDAALTFLSGRFPNYFKHIIWSLCDGSSGSLLYAGKNNAKISGLILCNPIIHFEHYNYIRRYYKGRIFHKEFWIRFVTLRLKFFEILFDSVEILKNYTLLIFKKILLRHAQVDESDFTDRIVCSIISCTVPINFILSTNDIIAQEFHQALHSCKIIKPLLERHVISISMVKGADHTFTQSESKEILFQETLNGIHKIIGP